MVGIAPVVRCGGRSWLAQIMEGGAMATWCIEGLAATYDETSHGLGRSEGNRYSERIRRGAFSKIVKEIEEGRQVVRCLADHNHKLELATTADGTLTIWEDADGLRYRAEVDDTGHEGILEQIAEMWRGSSFAFSTHGDSTSWEGALRTVRNVDTISELGPCTNPAYRRTTCKVYRKRSLDDVRQRIADLEREHPEFRNAPAVAVRPTFTGWRVWGYGLVFDQLSDDLGGFRERISRQALDGVDLRSVLSYYNHEENNLLGRTESGTLRLRVDSKGLRFEVDMARCRADVVESIRRGDVRGASFRFRVVKGGDTWTIEHGQTVRTVNRIEWLREVGPVVEPAYPSTMVFASYVPAAKV